VSINVLSNRICLLLLHGEADGGGLLKYAAGSDYGDGICLRSRTKVTSAASAECEKRKDGQRCQTEEHPSSSASAEPAEVAGKSQEWETGEHRQQGHGGVPLLAGEFEMSQSGGGLDGHYAWRAGAARCDGCGQE
jgi:hypothetical protein